MRYNIKTAILLIVFFILKLGVVEAASASLTLSEAMILALKHNPGLKAAGMTVEIAEADVARARARFLPQINFGESYSFSDNPSNVFTYKLNQRVFSQTDLLPNNINNPKPYGDFRTGISMSQPVFQAGEAYLGYQQARLGQKSANALVLNSRQGLLLNVIQTFYGLQLSQKRLVVIKAAKKTAGENLKIVKAHFESGMAVYADVLSAEAHFARLVQEELTSSNQVEIGRSAIDTVVGIRGLSERPLGPAPQEPAPLPGNLDELQRVAQEKRPDLQRLELAAQVAQKEHEKARLNYLPRVRVIAEYDVDQRRLFGNSGDSYTIIAVMNFNLFNGFADLAKMRESRAQKKQAEELRQELADRVRHQVTESILNLKTAHERLKVAQTAMTQAQESLRLKRLRYQEGFTILLDLLTSENAAKDAELDQVTTLFDTHLAQARLELALGTLSGPPSEQKTH